MKAIQKEKGKEEKVKKKNRGRKTIKDTSRANKVTIKKKDSSGKEKGGKKNERFQD